MKKHWLLSTEIMWVGLIGAAIILAFLASSFVSWSVGHEVLWPREDGTYGQVTLPLVTVMIVAGVTWSGGLLALAVIAACLAHEPLVIAISRRGSRAKREHRTECCGPKHFTRHVNSHVPVRVLLFLDA